MDNPFTPSFGVSPPLLVGRTPILEAVRWAMSEGVGSPGRATLITGVRGTGKTVSLNKIEDEARAAGWQVISVSARPGMTRELTDSILPELLHQADPEAMTSTVTGANASIAGLGAGLTRSQTDHHPVTPSLRSQLTTLTSFTERVGTGVLLSVDELNRRSADDLAQLLQTVQHGFREGQQLALVAAGLPHDVNALLQEEGTTFLRRAERHHLGPITPAETREALEEPIRVAGRAIDTPALEHAVAASRGYPFLVQLIGRHTWNADPAAEQITLEHAREGARASARRIGQLVHEPALSPLPGRQRQFLDAMSVDDGPSHVRDIAHRMGVDTNNVNIYRRRLIDADLIHPAGFGLVDYSLPYLREHLRDPSASTATSRPGGSGWDSIPTPDVRSRRDAPSPDDPAPATE